MALTGTGIGHEQLSEERRQYLIGRAKSIEHGSYQYGNEVRHLVGPNTPEHVLALTQRVMRATNAPGLMRAVRFRSGDLYTPKIAAMMTMPVLLIQGTEDRVNHGEKNAYVLIDHLPDDRLVKLEGLGHLPEVEDPDRVNGMLREFFAG
jgi:pimeloyl-ACP methyl ester carboxylesterase